MGDAAAIFSVQRAGRTLVQLAGARLARRFTRRIHSLPLCKQSLVLWTGKGGTRCRKGLELRISVYVTRAVTCGWAAPLLPLTHRSGRRPSAPLASVAEPRHADVQGSPCKPNHTPSTLIPLAHLWRLGQH